MDLFPARKVPVELLRDGGEEESHKQDLPGMLC